MPVLSTCSPSPSQKEKKKKLFKPARRDPARGERISVSSYDAEG